MTSPRGHGATWFFLFALAMGNTASAQQVVTGKNRPPTRIEPATEDSVREVVFRNLIDRDHAGLARMTTAFCVGISRDEFLKPANPTDRRDVAEPLFTQLRDETKRPLRNASECTYSMAGVRSSQSKERALLYNLGAIRWIDANRAEVAAAYYSDGFGSAGYTFTVTRASEEWKVRHWRMEWNAPAGKE